MARHVFIMIGALVAVGIAVGLVSPAHAQNPVPSVTIVSPAGDAPLKGGRTVLRVVIADALRPAKVMQVRVNGRVVEERLPEAGTNGFKPGEYVLDVPLGRGRNDVRVTLSNDVGDSVANVMLVHDGEGALDRRDTLYILAIGVDRYPGLGDTCGPKGTDSCDLKYSGADARRLAEAVERRLGPLHSKVVKRVLVNDAGADDAPTASNILDGLDLLRDARENDTVLLFIAAHGYNDGPNYRLLPTNAQRRGPDFRGDTVMPWQVLQDAVERAKGRRILLLDMAHSGSRSNQTLGNAAYYANILALTSARFDQQALDDPALGHSLFAAALVEGLQRPAGADKSEFSFEDLAQYVVRRVAELSKGRQEPQVVGGREAR